MTAILTPHVALGVAIAVMAMIAAYEMGRARRWGHLYATVPPPPAIDWAGILGFIAAVVVAVISVIA